MERCSSPLPETLKASVSRNAINLLPTQTTSAINPSPNNSARLVSSTFFNLNAGDILQLALAVTSAISKPVDLTITENGDCTFTVKQVA